MIRSTTVAIAAAFVVFGTSTALAQGNRDKAKPKSPAQAESRGFSEAEVELIIGFFSEHKQSVESLPPGIAKNVARGKPLPPGIAKRQLPDALLRQLPEREGLEVAIVGEKVVLLEVGGLVVDVLEEIF